MTVIFQNKGLIDLRGITTFGLCVKPETMNPIGYFGTGLKYALAVLLREGLKVTLQRGTTKGKFGVKMRKVRGFDVPIVQMNGTDLPFTTELGKNWKPWMAYRELAANAMDEPETRITDDPEVLRTAGYTSFIVEGDKIDAIFDDHDQIFLRTEPRYKFDSVELHDGPDVGQWIYYRGIRVYELPRGAMYNYNLLHEEKLTEDRTLTSVYRAYRAIAKAIVECDNAGLIRQMLEAHQNYFEGSIDYSWGYTTPGETFNKVVERYYHTGTSYNTSAKNLYESRTPRKPAPTVVMWETVPMENRRKLWAALKFWG